jgi:hypothetical protein
MSRKIGRVGVIAAWLASVTPLMAQTTNFGPYDVDATKPRPTGWTVTPGIAFAVASDDNVLSRADIDAPVSDYTTIINPRIGLSLNGRFSQLDASYSGAFLRYRELDTLNSYDQQASLYARRQLTKRIMLFADDSFAIAPTTELVQFVGVPFVRTGSAIENVRGGIEVKLSARTLVSGSYNFEWLRFDANGAFAQQLQGGHSHGVTGAWRYNLSELTAIVADYDRQYATVTNTLGTFDIQNISAGLERRLSEFVHVFGSLGIARVAVSAYGPARTGPAWRTGIARQFRRAGVDVVYSRSFVPSYGFGGTLQNEEVTGRARIPLARRVAAQSSVSWRSNEALTPGQPNLHSFWIEGNIGYAWQPWLRIEGFYAGSRQTIDRPGGLVDRRHIGVQIVTSNPVRIR